MQNRVTTKKIIRNGVFSLNNIIDKAILKSREIRLNLRLNKLLRIHSIKSKISQIDRTKLKDIWGKMYNRNIYKSYKFYSYVNGEKSYYYVPDSIFYGRIDPYLCNYKYSEGLDNKAYYKMFFSDLNQPKTILKKINGFYYKGDSEIINEDEVHTLFCDNESYVIKPITNSMGGQGIEVYDKTNPVNINKIKKQNNFIIQQFISQHDQLEKIYKKSINTIRVITFLWDNNVNVLSSVLRIGRDDNRIDNLTSGGLVVGLNKDGTLKKYAYDNDGIQYEFHPNTKVYFEGHKIPGYHKIIDIVTTYAKIFPDFQLISWDFSIDKNAEPVFIEFNTKMNGLKSHQYCNGPIFKPFLAEILREIQLAL